MESILSEEYVPLARPLFMYPNKKVMLERPEVAEFMKFCRLGRVSARSSKRRGLFE